MQVGKKQVIPGLEQGLLGMKVRTESRDQLFFLGVSLLASLHLMQPCWQAGEERQLFVPARLGYGARYSCSGADEQRVQNGGGGARAGAGVS